MDIKYSKALERLKKIFDEALVPAILDEAGKDGLTVDMLSTFHTDLGIGDHEVEGNFFFTETGIFSCIMTVLTDIPRENSRALYELAAKTGFYLTFGGFGMDKDGSSLIYRFDQMIAEDITEDKLFDNIDSLAGIALDTVDTWIDAFADVAAGNKEAGEAILDTMEDILQ